jgi:hypothetical protein
MLKVGDDSRLDAVVYGLKLVPRDVRNRINRETRATLKPIWQQEIQKHLAGTSSFTTRMIGKGLVSGGNPPVMRAATSRRPLRPGGVTPDAEGYLAEFGGRDTLYSTYRRRSKNGGRHDVKRRTKLGLPQTDRRGRVAYPAAADVAPRMASLWVQLFVRSVYEALEE